MCQLQYIDELGQDNTWVNEKLQYSIRKFRYYKRVIIRNLHPVDNANKTLQLNSDQIHPGEMVRVRSKFEINKALNRFNNTRGCIFLPEMYNHCGKEYRVFKKVDYFFDEYKQKMSKCNGIFLLEGCYCNGTATYLGKCDRNCFLFWQASWLEKV